jgi:hypothetical protein
VKSRRLTLVPAVEKGNFADVKFQVEEIPAQIKEDVSLLDRGRSRDGSMELMNFILDCASGDSCLMTAKEIEVKMGFDRE